MPQTNSRQNGFIDRLTKITEANLSNEQFGVSELAGQAGMSRSNLHRRLKAATGQSISQFIRQIRLEKAHSLLRESDSTISEIAFECGFHSVSYFSKCFHDHYGHPPGQIRKDELVNADPEVPQAEETLQSAKKKRIIHFLAISTSILIVGAVILLFTLNPFDIKQISPDKSIAILPFRNDSPKEDKMYFLNSIQTAIIDNLSKIEDLRVNDRMDVEKYRLDPKPPSVIAKEMNVGYVLDGNGHQDGDNISLSIRLIDAKRGKQIWSRSFIRKASETFSMTSEISQSLAREISAFISPQEMERIASEPTSSLKAWEYYVRGENRFSDAQLYYDTLALLEAEILFHKALEADSSFAKPLARLAALAISKISLGLETLPDEVMNDSIHGLIEKALALDEQCAEAYTVKGFILAFTGTFEESVQAFEKGIMYKPNYWETYYQLGNVYNWHGLHIAALENYHKASILHRGTLLPEIFQKMAELFRNFGFEDKAREYLKAYLQLMPDSIGYFYSMSTLAHWFNRSEESIRFSQKVIEIDTGQVIAINRLAYAHLYLGNYVESLKYWNRLERFYGDGPVFLNARQRLAYVHLQLGDSAIANSYLDTMVEDIKIKIESGDALGSDYYNLAGIQAFRGNKEPAMNNLQVYRKSIPDIGINMVFWWFNLIRSDVMFESIRDEPEFKEILQELDSRYKKVHHEISSWLEENDLI